MELSWFLTDWDWLLVSSHLHSQSGESGHQQLSPLSWYNISIIFLIFPAKYYQIGPLNLCSDNTWIYALSNKLNTPTVMRERFSSFTTTGKVVTPWSSGSLDDTKWSVEVSSMSWLRELCRSFKEFLHNRNLGSDVSSSNGKGQCLEII